ncbi:Putative FMN-binding domain-containing protein [Gracilibacillus ureilyticus]|uniref:Putative FMN-binding domain-containing protein n=1 Tax=Gracilibacillus ureilyticus TaxID=531814 RepID=A0A1H9VAD3_9BACI|nr:FMN-binding negative transcriptional regulator [Gracilibacillus ureilyticus]SES18726.1 Putative FMN-binding domain-containing protein [Gracilibacillus ureilyticus]
MYIPKAFEVNEKGKIYDFIKQNSFGVLFSEEEIGPSATHLPFLMEEKEDGSAVFPRC